MKRKLFFTGIIALILLALVTLSGVLSSLIIGLVIAYVLDPFVDFFEVRGVRRTLGITFIFSIIIAALILFVMFVAPVISREVTAFTRKVPDYVSRLQENTWPFVKDYMARHPDQVEAAKEKLQAIGVEVLMPVVNFIRNLFSGVINVVLGILDLILIPVMAFYLLKDIDRLREKLVLLVPPRHRETVQDIGGEIDTVLKDFLKGQIIVSLILAVIYAVGLSICRVPLGIAIGLVAGLANMIPYLGIAIGLAPALLLSWLDAHSLPLLIGVVATFGIAQALEGSVISPKVVGEKVGLHPVTVIVAILLGGHFFGFTGILAAVPVAAVVNVLTRRAYRWYLDSEYFNG